MNNKPKKRVTISDVAKQAGVSITTVSFAYNRPEQVGDNTIVRIKKVAEELGYSPNLYAKALLSGCSNTIGVLVPQGLESIYANPFYPELFRGIGQVCDEKNYGLNIISPVEGSLENAINRALVDGFIVVGINESHKEVAPLIKRDIPLIFIDGDVENNYCINSDDENGAYLAAKYFCEKGIQDIAIFNFETPDFYKSEGFYGVGGMRMRGYKRALEEFGMSWNKVIKIPTHASIKGGYHQFEKLIKNRRVPRAILAVSDVMAIGILQAAIKYNLNAPIDFELIGFDNIVMSKYVHPSLSTVHQPVLEKGQISAEILFSLLNKEDMVFDQNTLLSTKIIHRGSTRKLN